MLLLLALLRNILKMIKNLYVILALFFVFKINAQEGIPVYSDYLMDNYYLVHPSMAGASNCSKLRLTGRQQWFGQENAPSLMTASYNVRFDEYKPSAAGIILFNDKNGFHSQTGAYLTYAHHIMLGRNRVDLNMVSFGISGGFIQSSLDESQWVLFDPLNSGVSQSEVYYNVDIGASYHLLDFYAHVTVKNILGTGRTLYTEQESTNLRKYLVSMGYVFSKYGNPWTVEPSVLFQHIPETKESLFDINAKVYRKLDFGKVWGGVSYRSSLDGAEYATANGSGVSQKLQYITPFIGVNYNNYMFGYTYSHQSGQVKLAAGGFHQITLGVNIGCKPQKYECDCPGIN